jgi:hypothetical protein
VERGGGSITKVACQGHGTLKPQNTQSSQQEEVSTNSLLSDPPSDPQQLFYGIVVVGIVLRGIALARAT